jgi:hypothetical protein
MVMSTEAKAALLKRLQDGRAKTKAARADAKEKGLPDPKPRKARKDKKLKAVVDPMTVKGDRETVAPIDGAPAMAKNKVSAMPVDPSETVTSKIDVPNLPDAASRKKIVKDAAPIPEAKDPKDLSTSGKTKAYDINDLLMNKETGNQVIPEMVPGQKESLLDALKENKKQDKPLANDPVPTPPEKTVANISRHVPDIKAVRGREPFSFSAIRKQLYQ